MGTLDSSYATYNPCLLIVREKGWEVRVRCYEKKQPRCLYFAVKDELQLVGNSGPELLGLVVLWEKYGENWNQQSPDIIAEVIDNDDEVIE